MEYRYGRKQGKRLIPVNYRPASKMPIDLQSLQFVDFQQSYDAGLRDLLVALHR
jgi:hypothetical protein